MSANGKMSKLSKCRLMAKRALTADSKLYETACRSCEEELSVLSESVAARVRGLLPRGREDWPSLNEIAGELAMARQSAACATGEHPARPLPNFVFQAKHQGTR